MPSPLKLAIGFEALKNANILTPEIQKIIITGKNPEKIANCLVLLNESNILNKENREIFIKHVNPILIEKILNILKSAGILTQDNFDYVIKYKNPSALKIALQDLFASKEFRFRDVFENKINPEINFIAKIIGLMEDSFIRQNLLRNPKKLILYASANRLLNKKDPVYQSIIKTKQNITCLYQLDRTRKTNFQQSLGPDIINKIAFFGAGNEEWDGMDQETVNYISSYTPLKK